MGWKEQELGETLHVVKVKQFWEAQKKHIAIFPYIYVLIVLTSNLKSTQYAQRCMGNQTCDGRMTSDAFYLAS